MSDNPSQVKALDKPLRASDTLPDNSSGGDSATNPQLEASRTMSSPPQNGSGGNEFLGRFTPNQNSGSSLANIILADESGRNTQQNNATERSNPSTGTDSTSTMRSDSRRVLSTSERFGQGDAVVTKRNGLLPTEIRNSVVDNDGNTLLQVRTREGDTNKFELNEYDAAGKLVRSEKEQNVHINEKGQVEYQLPPKNSTDFMFQLMLGQDKFTAGSLPSSKEHFVEVASAKGLFNGNRATAEKYINMYVNRMHKRVEDGFKAANDDQIAKSLDHLASIYEDGKTSKFSQATVNKVVAGELKSLANPEKYNNQGQVGSCYLNTCLFIAETLHPEGIAKMTAKVLTTGKWRGHEFNNHDLQAAYGRDSFNQFATSALGKTFGFNRMDPNFRGTTETEAQHAYKALTGDRLPIGRNALSKYGIAAVYTYGGGHAQVDFLKKVNGKTITDRENWWNGYAEGRA